MQKRSLRFSHVFADKDDPVEFYCLLCHVPCSALSLLVGDHTNHPRRRLDEAAETAPSDLMQEAAEFEHCVNQFRTAIATRQEKHRLTQRCLEEEMRRIDNAMAQLERERDSCAQHWEAFSEEARDLAELDFGRLKDLRHAGEGLIRATESWRDHYDGEVAAQQQRRFGAAGDDAAQRSDNGSAVSSAALGIAKNSGVADLEQVRMRLQRVVKHLTSLPLVLSEQEHACMRTCPSAAAPTRDLANSHFFQQRSTHVGVSRSQRDSHILLRHPLAESGHHQENISREHNVFADDAIDQPSQGGKERSGRGRNHGGNPTQRRSSGYENHLVEEPSSLDSSSTSLSTSPTSDGKTNSHNDRRWNHDHNNMKSSTTRGAAAPAASMESPTASTGGNSKGAHLAKRATLLRQYYHLRSCLQDAIDSDQPATLVKLFVRSIRRLRDSARTAGFEADVERAAVGDPEYAMLFGDI